jgi:hypothetical protein
LKQLFFWLEMFVHCKTRLKYVINMPSGIFPEFSAPLRSGIKSRSKIQNMIQFPNLFYFFDHNMPLIEIPMLPFQWPNSRHRTNMSFDLISSSLGFFRKIVLMMVDLMPEELPDVASERVVVPAPPRGRDANCPVAGTRVVSDALGEPPVALAQLVRAGSLARPGRPPWKANWSAFALPLVWHSVVA